MIGLDDTEYEAGWLVFSDAGQMLLDRARDADTKPLCLCVSGGLPMYLRRRNGRLWVCRMPNTGFRHAPNCRSIEDIEPLLDGSLHFEPGVIKRDTAETIHIRLKKNAEGLDAFGMDGLLDLVCAEAGLDICMEAGKYRNWTIAASVLRAAALRITWGNGAAGELMLIPDQFDSKIGRSKIDGIYLPFLRAGREMERFVLAPVKATSRTQYGWDLTLKHLPRVHFWVNERLLNDAESRPGFPSFSSLTGESENSYLCLARIWPSEKEGFMVTEMAIRQHTRNFVPIQGEQAAAEIERLLSKGKTVKSVMRYQTRERLAQLAVLGDHGVIEPRFI